VNLEDHFAGDGIGHAEITAKVLQHLAAASERRGSSSRPVHSPDARSGAAAGAVSRHPPLGVHRGVESIDIALGVGDRFQRQADGAVVPAALDLVGIDRPRARPADRLPV